MGEIAEGAAPTPDRDGRLGTRLDSWKEIAAYLSRDIRTVQRWEKTAGLPVRRLQRPGLRAVFAYTADLDSWLEKQQADGLDEEPAPARENGANAPPPRTGRTLPYAAIAIAAILILASIALWKFGGIAREPLSARPLTADPGTERDPDISPDGRYVAYAAEGSAGSSSIYLKQVDGGEPKLLTSSSGTDDLSPAWSPDGGTLAFLRGAPMGDAGLYLVPSLGGEERKIAEIQPYARRRTMMLGHLLAWTPDGRFLILPDRRGAKQGALFLMNVETRRKTQLTFPTEGVYDVEPSLSSDGRRLLFTRVTEEMVARLYIQDLDARYQPRGSPHVLAQAGNWNSSGRFLEGNRDVVFCAGNLPRLALWRQSASGSQKPVSLGIIGDHGVQIALHPPTGKLVSRTFRMRSDILRFPIPAAPAKEPQAPQVETFIESSFVDRSPVYSPDGSRLAFISDRTGKRQIWVAALDGSRPTEWTRNMEVDGLPPTWSRDGKRILFAESSTGNGQLFILDAATKTPARITHDTLDYTNAKWSLNGEFFYAVAVEKGVSSLYRLRTTGGPAEKILSDVVFMAGEAPDGMSLYIMKPEATSRRILHRVWLDNQRLEPIAPIRFLEDVFVTGEAVYYLTPVDGGKSNEVHLLKRTHDGAVRMVQHYTKSPGRGLQISPDGRSALTTLIVPPMSDLMLIESVK